MKIVIAGAGDIGFHLAELLSSEEHDIILIDNNQEVLAYAHNQLDVVTLRGNSASISILEMANVSSADLLIAVTSSEENNIITAILGKKMGAKKTIARDNDNQYVDDPKQISYFKQLGIDSIMSPRQLAAREIVRLVNEAALTDLFEFENGLLSLIGVHVTEKAKLVNKTLIEIAKRYSTDEFMLVAISRNGQSLVPRGETMIKEDDFLYFVTKKNYIGKVLKLTGKRRIKLKNIMILGGDTTIARLTAKLLEKDYNVTLLESDSKDCLELAEQLENTLIINADSRNTDVLVEEGIDNMDAFLALHKNSESNIISSLIAKEHGVAKTIALVNNKDYITVSKNIGVDTLINKKLITANNIFRHIRRGTIKAITGIHGIDAEVIEFVVNTDAPITKRVIKRLQFPAKALIGGIIRDNKAYIPNGDFRIMAEDKVVVFCLTEVIEEVEHFFI